MSKFEIELPAALSEFIEGQVEAGLYNNAADAIQDAVRRLSEEDWSGKEAAIRAALAPGVAEADAGIFFDGTMRDIIADARAANSKRK